MTRVSLVDYRRSLLERKLDELTAANDKLRDRLEWAELPSLFIHERDLGAEFASWLNERRTHDQGWPP